MCGVTLSRRSVEEMAWSPGSRAVLFWGACIPFRAYLASRGNDPLLRAAAVIISYRWLSGSEAAHTGQFGGPAFWAKQRPLHGGLWAAYAVTGDADWLWADVAFGGANWLVQHHAWLV